jgi:hypothetical protein
MPISGKVVFPLKWWFRPRTELAAVPILRVGEGPPIDPEDLSSILHELNDRQYAAVREILLEARMKAESVLNDEKVVSDFGRLAYYNGWKAYADHVLASFEGIREQGRGLIMG